MKRILITGGAGFIGSHLVKRLADRGYILTVLDNLERGKLANLPTMLNNVRFYNVDLRDYPSIVDYFANQDCVIHLASKVGGIGVYVNHPYDVFRANVEIDSNVLKASIKNNIPKYFYASSAHVYPKELQSVKDSPKIKETDAYPANCELSYGWAKLMGELELEYARKQLPTLKYAIARFIGIYGPNQDFELETGSVIPVFSNRAINYPQVPFRIKGTGEEMRSYCYIDDALDCIELMIDKLDTADVVGPLNVGKEQRVSINEIAKNIVDISKKDIKIEYDTSSSTLIWGQWCDCQLVKEVLGWEATTTLYDGLKVVYEDVHTRILNKQ